MEFVNFDAVLLLSFGGPEGPEQVRPFLENVTRGRNVPPERLDDVAEHYLHFGGVSPINGINRALITQLRAELVDHGLDLPVVLRQPQLGALRRRHCCNDARQRYSSCSGVHHVGVERLLQLHAVCRGHRPGPAGGRAGRPRAGETTAVLRPPTVRRDVRRGHRGGGRDLACGPRGDARLVFTAHSVPVAADQRCGPQLYSRQVAYATRLVAAAAGYTDYDLAWQSRSGPPQVPWLEPDVADHLTTLAAAGTKAVIVCPIGFVADHIEVVWDLDHELRLQAEAAGIAFARAATPNADRRFARLAAGLIDELRLDQAPARVTGPDPVPGCLASVNGAPCRPPHCVAAQRS